MVKPKSLLPECGLYLTTKPLPEHETAIPSGVLVYFHNHSDSGLPLVIAPDHNIHNRWHFHGAGIPFRGLSWADSLVKLPAEGFYMMRRALPFEGGEWPKGGLIQLGYTRNGDPILFIAQVRAQLEENDLFFSDRGVTVTREQLPMLEPLHIFAEPAPAGVHTSGVH
jgi:hypothetical protein